MSGTHIRVLPKADSLVLHHGCTPPWWGCPRLDVRRAVEALCLGLAEAGGSALSSRCCADSQGCLPGAEAPCRDLPGQFERCLGAALTAFSPRSAEVGTIFALSWLITWFGHVLSDFRHVVRLYDFFLACHPLMPIYFAAVVGAGWRDGGGLTAPPWGAGGLPRVKPPPCCALSRQGRASPSRKGRSSRQE